MDLFYLSVPPDSHLLLFIGHRVQLNKLLFFLIVVDGGNCRTNCNCNQDSKALNPSCISVLWAGQPDFQTNGDER